MIKTVWIRLEPDEINSDVDNRVSHLFLSDKDKLCDPANMWQNQNNY